ncbi:MAG: hypothetical protein ABFS56_13905 [Pseudomonadota bacterium]
MSKLNLDYNHLMASSPTLIAWLDKLNYATSDDTAKAARDYTATSGIMPV